MNIKQPLIFYDATGFTDKPEWYTSSVPGIRVITTSQWHSQDWTRMIAKAVSAQENGQLLLIDIEHSKQLEDKFDRKITDDELFSIACQTVDRVRAGAPTTRIGIWVSNKHRDYSNYDNLRGDKDPNGVRARRNVTISSDWIGIGAYIWHSNIAQWLSWYPDLIHDRRKAIRTPIICYINTLLDDGTPVPLDHLEQIYEAIGKDIEGICWFSKWKQRFIPFDERMPWVQFTKFYLS